MRRLAALAALVLVLAGCSEDRECLSGHTERQTTVTPIYSGSVNGVGIWSYIPTESDVFVCDEYAPEER